MFESTAKPVVRNPYNYDRDEASRKSGLECLDPSLTSQEFAEDTDINVMLEKYGVTGELTLNASKALQGDFTEVGDYRSQLDAIRAAEAAFNDLPAQVRRHFGDNPADFIAYTQDEKNIDQLRQWGLLAVEPDVPKAARLEDVIEAIKAQQGAKNDA